uniref:Uncharacterized protein n=1 Tax=Arundo donax TaxID=35708 RepID=A0A0A9BW25_ARUDO
MLSFVLEHEPSYNYGSGYFGHSWQLSKLHDSFGQDSSTRSHQRLM